MNDFDPSLLGTASRRRFLRGGAATVALPFELLGSGAVQAVKLPHSPDYGPLAPVNDGATGLPLLQLPDGFRYWSFGWTGDVMSDGVPTPSLHDGMAVVAQDGPRLVLVRNHEQSGTGGAFARPELTFDPRCNGGTTTLTFEPRQGRWLGDRASLSGTLRNCAGGPTPWGSWLTCEETWSGPQMGPAYTRQHGWVFEVPGLGPAQPQPLTALGCFSHEACAVDPATGIVYQTEDSDPSGFYRFIPQVKGRLDQGGRLQMMKLVASANRRRSLGGHTFSHFDTGPASAAGSTWETQWVDIAEPARPFITGTTYGGVVAQGLAQGASSIVRGEGCWYGNGLVYLCSTSGGPAGKGQVFAHDPQRQTFTLLYAATGLGGVDHPDNIACSPRGGSLLLCEDGEAVPQGLRGLTTDGSVFPFCHNHLNFRAGAIGAYTRPSGRTFTGDQRGQEFAGATFWGEWLFFNIQTPGITFAVTGPWDRGAL